MMGMLKAKQIWHLNACSSFVFVPPLLRAGALRQREQKKTSRKTLHVQDVAPVGQGESFVRCEIFLRSM